MSNRQINPPSFHRFSILIPFILLVAENTPPPSDLFGAENIPPPPASTQHTQHPHPKHPSHKERSRPPRPTGELPLHRTCPVAHRNRVRHRPQPSQRRWGPVSFPTKSLAAFPVESFAESFDFGEYGLRSKRIAITRTDAKEFEK